MKLQLTLFQIAQTNTTIFIYQYGKDDEDNLAQLFIKKGKRNTNEIIDFDDEFENVSSFKIAAYTKNDRQQPISNVLSIDIPGIGYCAFLFIFSCVRLFIMYMILSTNKVKRR